jgi:hypothetical protein
LKNIVLVISGSPAHIGSPGPRGNRQNGPTERESAIGDLYRIPLADIRSGSPADLLDIYGAQARELARASMDMFGPVAPAARTVALPIADRITRAWLARTQNPYLGEIDAIAARLGIAGVYALNVVFEWSCTSGVFETESGVTLRRVLDWGFPRLGENLVVAQQTGAAGDFHNITWPGIAGIYQAVACGRFAAAINQAPMRRHGLGLASDWFRNRLAVHKAGGMPPAFLLRQVFETARDYASAKEMLCRSPVAVPVIYTLAGTRVQEGCVIERVENDFALREMTGDRVCAANHFLSHLNGYGSGWLPRSHDSGERARSVEALSMRDIETEFAWFAPPIANPKSRLALNANAAIGEFSLIGTAGVRPVTEIFRLATERAI